MSNCSDCTHRTYLDAKLFCLAGFRPRFYKPRDEMDRDWGWKRKNCDQFSRRPNDGSDSCITCRCGGITWHVLLNGNLECSSCQSIMCAVDDGWDYIG